jgi:site-specific DNA-methyltransferase (adenine-specific)
MAKLPFDLICEDALVALRGLPSESIDLIFADPPYFLSNDGFTVKSGQMASVNKGDWDRSLGFQEELEFHEGWIKESLRVLKPNGSLFISGTYHSIYKCGFLLQSLGARIVNDLVWFKPNGAPALAGRNFTASHETLIWATKSKTAKHYFDYKASKEWRDEKDKILNPGKQMRSVWSIPTTPAREKVIGKHPTQKPLELLERIVALCSKQGDLVLDPFCGSGTTGVACVNLGRRFIGIDLEDDYIQLSRERIMRAHETLANP